MECTPSCRLPFHADVVLSAVTRETLADVQNFMKYFCANGDKVRDSFGRNALHVAVSCGKTELVKWLLEQRCLPIDERDYECGWTALHRSCYYGHLPCALLLIQHGANIYEKDFEGITPVELLFRDSLRNNKAIQNMTLSFIKDQKKASSLIDVSTWGTNINFTLGHGDQNERHTPEIIDVFSKHSHVNIAEVVVCKFHSVFLASNGSVWTCGHGQGGRLGHGHEKTILIPKKIDYLTNEMCVSIAAGQDHTVILCENGSVFTCGLNKYHQMGHHTALSQYTTPKQIQNKTLKGKTFIGIAASNYHTVLYTSKEVFTFGLNAGQLGHAKGDKTQITPRQISVLHSRDISITLATCSDSATVALTQHGDIHILHQYSHKRIITKLRSISKLVVSGGSLDENHKDFIETKKPSPLVIYGLYEGGKVIQWRETDNTVRECYFSLHKNISARDIAIGRGLHITTDEGEVYFEDKNVASVKKPTTIAQRNLKFLPYNTALKQNEVMKLSLERVKHVHRALKISCDQFSQNFAILQTDPSVGSESRVRISPGQIRYHLSSLLENSEEEHDVKIKVKDKYLYAHKFVLAHAGDKLKKILDSSETITPTVTCFNDEKCEVVQEIVDYLYTGTCASLYNEIHPITNENLGVDVEVFPEELLWSLDEIDLSELDHFETSFQPCRRKSREEQRVATEEKCHKQLNGAFMGDAKQRKEILRVAKKYKINNLITRLQSAATNEKICHPRFFRNMYPEYHDVVIEAQDGIEFACHKCILAARLEYFSIMLTTTWVESCDDFVHLKMPIDSRVLKVILDFLYTDEAPTIKENQDLEFLGTLLTITDQLWIIRLKELCEARLSSLICLKNVVEMLEFSSLYNANQLKNVCTEFICLNMSYLFENRSLEFLNEETLHELSKAYRQSTPSMAWRVLTPSDVHLAVAVPQPESPTKQRRKWRKKSRLSDSDTIDTNTTTETNDNINENDVNGTAMEEIGATCNDEATEMNIKFDEMNIEVENVNEVGDSYKQNGEEKGGGWWYRKNTGILTPTVVSSSGKEKSVSNALQIIENDESDNNKTIPPWATSPNSPQMCDLRTIMEQEINNDSGRKQKEGRSPSAGKSRPSQKERKKMRKLSEEDTNKIEHEISTSPENICSPVNPWKKCSLVAGQPLSFRDLLKEEESLKVDFERHETVAHQRTNVVPIPTHCRVARNQKVSPRTSASVWENTVGFSPSPTDTLKFNEIQHLQEEERSLQEKNKKKPLSLIQLEDKAIEELLQYYGGCYNPCEHVEVKRETRTAENPSWVT